MEDKGRVTTRIVGYIKEQILSGAWPVGSRIPSEHQLCQTLECSRVSIRSALQQFIAIGAIESIRGKGTYVRSSNLGALGMPMSSLPYDRIIDMLQFIDIIWPTMCIQAVRRYGEALLPPLWTALEQMRHLTPSQDPELNVLIGDFHRSIAQSFHNETLMRTCAGVLSMLSQNPCTADHSISYLGTVYYHNLLYNAIAEQDEARIEQVFHDYIDHIQKNFFVSPDQASDAPPPQ